MTIVLQNYINVYYDSRKKDIFAFPYHEIPNFEAQPVKTFFVTGTFTKYRN